MRNNFLSVHQTPGIRIQQRQHDQEGKAAKQNQSRRV